MPEMMSCTANQMEIPRSPTESARAWERLKGLLPTEELTVGHAGTDRDQGADDPVQAAINQELARGLFHSKPGHVLLVGSPGVGKTSLLRRFGQQVQQGDFPFLKGVRVISVDVSNVDPEDSRACLELIFVAVKEWGRVRMALCYVA
jgi:Cdc6-like AAA superfamily ATPase